MESSNFAHSKVAEVEKENSGVEAAHKTEQSGEDVYRFFKGALQRENGKTESESCKAGEKADAERGQFPLSEVLGRKSGNAGKDHSEAVAEKTAKAAYQTGICKSKTGGTDSESRKGNSGEVRESFTAAARKIQEIASKNVSLLLAIGAFSVLLVMIMTAVSSCGAMFAGGISTTLAGSYMSVPAEIDAADLAFSELEKELQAEIDAIETTYPDYDEYRYNLASIGHDPFALISYLSAVHTEFTASEVQAEIEYLFDEMYELTLNPTEETRTRTVTKTGTHTVTDPVTGKQQKRNTSMKWKRNIP